MKFLLLFLFVAVISCKYGEEKKNFIPLTDIEKLQKSIDSLFNSEIDANGPGAAVAVIYDGEMLIGKGYGLRDIENKKPITVQTNMRMGSVSKQFTALAVLSLVDRGLISLSDTVYKYLPYKAFKDITIKQLLYHTSGIDDYNEHLPENWDRTEIAENKHALEWYRDNTKSLYAPGEKWDYSNGGYNILATIVEKVSGEDFETYAKENVFQKAGMENTYFFNLAKPVKIREKAYAYEKDSLGNWQKMDGYFLEGMLGEGAVFTNLIDFVDYDIALRNREILSNSLHQLIFEPGSKKIPRSFYTVGDVIIEGFEKDKIYYYGMGWFVTEGRATHPGGWRGTRTVVYRDLERPLIIAIFRNSRTSPAILFHKTLALTEAFLK